MNPDDDIHRILLEISKMIKKVQAGISYKITIIKIKIQTAVILNEKWKTK